LTKLFRDKTETIEPGFGIEKLFLVAVIAEPLQQDQTTSSLIENEVVDITPLIDIFGNRGQRVYRVAPFPSDVPERSVQRIGAASVEVVAAWPSSWPRPVRLLVRPELIEVMALLPDHPPATITWRGKRRRVQSADGPERIFGEWWERTSEWAAVRDYFVVEDDSGERLWIFRSGDGIDGATGSHAWYVQGIFA
jgi:protein ImuB